LKGYHGEGGHARPDHRQRGFPTRKPGVEEADAGDHDEHHARRDENVGYVAGLVPLIEVSGSWLISAMSQRESRRGLLESPPLGSVPLNSAGAPTYPYDISEFEGLDSEQSINQ